MAGPADRAGAAAALVRPPAEIRARRRCARARARLTPDRARCWQRPEKPPEDALIKVSAVASALGTKPARDMTAALIAGQRDPRVPASLARGRMTAKHGAGAGALAGHHGELAPLPRDQITFPAARITQPPARISGQLTAIRHARGNRCRRHPRPGRRARQRRGGAARPRPAR